MKKRLAVIMAAGALIAGSIAGPASAGTSYYKSYFYVPHPVNCYWYPSHVTGTAQPTGVRTTKGYQCVRYVLVRWE